MKQANPNRTIKQFKRTFTETKLNKLGKETGFCHRQREITPYRLALGMLDVFSNYEVKTIADIQRGFNALCEKQVQYKPFHNQLAKRTFPVFMHSLYEHLLSHLARDHCLTGLFLWLLINRWCCCMVLLKRPGKHRNRI